MRSPRWRCFLERGLDTEEESRQRVRFGRRDIGEEVADAPAKQILRRLQRTLAGHRQDERLATPVGGDRRALEETGVREPREELGNRCSRDAGLAGQLGPRHVLARDCP